MPTAETLLEWQNLSPDRQPVTGTDPKGMIHAIGVFPIEQVHLEDHQQRFRRLAERWRSERRLARTATSAAMHPAYQEIIGLGREGLPFILRELEREVDHWFWALRAITGVDPVPPSDRGDLEKMAQAWLRWAHHQGLIW